MDRNFAFLPLVYNKNKSFIFIIAETILIHVFS